MKLTAKQRAFIQSKIAILGLGRNNWHVFSWLIKHGARRVTICDRNKDIRRKVAASRLGKLSARVTFQLGDDYLSHLEKFDIIIRTPGIPFLHPKIQAAKQQGVIISSQTKLFFNLCPAKIIGITGTKGKGTTANLLFRILTKKFIGTEANAYLAGNLGINPFEFLDQLLPEDEVIYELSSFQLQDMTKSPHLAIVLNVTSDHLDYHRDEREYIQAKYPIVAHQTKNDAAIINADYLTSFAFAGLTNGQVWWFSSRAPVDQGAYVSQGKIWLKTPIFNFALLEVDQLKLAGRHNLENILAASLAGYLLGANPKEIRRAILSFKPLEHRLEPVLERDNFIVINDSYATNPTAVQAALKAYPKSRLIMGGTSKGVRFKQIAGLVKSETKKVYLFGKAADEIAADFGSLKNKIKEFKFLRTAVQAALKDARPGDTILFSPGCASFDEFKHAAERGRVFKRLVYDYFN